MKRSYETQQSSAAVFPPIITQDSIRKAIERFQDKIIAVKSDKTHVCASCGLFIISKALRFLHQWDPIFQAAVACQSLAEAALDCCACIEDGYYFCLPCFNSIAKPKPPKLSAANAVNTIFCQSYPKELTHLTLAEEAFIAKAHPVISILKLKPSKSSVGISYQRIRGHAVVLP